MTGIRSARPRDAELALRRLGPGHQPGVGLNPLLACRVSYGEPGEVGDGFLGLALSLSLSVGVLVASRDVSADLSVL